MRFTNRTINTTLRLIFIGLFALTMNACGYRFGTERLEDTETVAVPVFANQTLRRGFERDLTRDVLREIKESTTYLIENEKSADLIIRGEILAIDETVLVEGSDDQVLESNIEVTVQIELLDSEGNRLPVRRQTGRGGDNYRSILKDRAEFIPSRGETRDTATREALREMAERIVQILNTY